jgi:hypothetical protein
MAVLDKTTRLMLFQIRFVLRGGSVYPDLETANIE